MKKAIAVLTATLISLTSLHAQDEGPRFGIKLAPNMSWLRPDSKGLTSNGNKLSYTFGLMAEFPVGQTGNYRFATGAFLNNVGGNYTTEYRFVDATNLEGPIQLKGMEQDLTLRYVELPFTMKMMTNEIGYMRYFGQIGVSTGFNIRAKADYEVPDIVATTNAGQPVVRGFNKLEDEDIKNDVNLFRANLVVGAGAEYNFSGTTSLLVGITYNNGFTNLLNNVDGPDGKKAKLFSDYLELTLGVFF